MYGYIYKVILPKGALNKNGKPFYIGKRERPIVEKTYFGSGTLVMMWFRKFGLKSNNCQLKIAEQLGVERIIIGRSKTKKGLERLEKKYVSKVYGSDLCLNLTNDGKGKMPNGKKLSDRVKTNIQKNLKERNFIPGMKGKHHSKQTLRKLRKAFLGSNWYNDGKVEVQAFSCPPGFILGRISNGRVDYKHSEETKIKMSKARSGLKWFTNDEVSIQAKKCPNGYKPGYHFHAASSKGKKWFTDGIKTTMAFECPEGFWPGHHFIIKDDRPKGKRWYTNGVDNVISFECPEGYRFGRTLIKTVKEQKAAA